MKHTYYIALVTLAVTGYYTYFGQMVPQKEVHPPETLDLTASMSSEEMVQAGEKIYNGKGTCISCHKLSGGSGRFPDLGGIGQRASSQKSGLSDVEYLAESLYRPDKYIVPGYSPGMPRVDKAPIGLSHMEIKALIAYLQSLGGAVSIKMNTALAYEGGEGGEEEMAVIPGKDIPPINIKALSKSSPAAVSTGKTIYMTYCSACHGNAGKGDGPAGLAMNPKPRDFTSLKGWTKGTKFSDIYEVLEVGIVERGMAAFPTISRADRVKVIHYVRSLAKYPAITSGELAALDKKFSLSKGQKSAGQIPIKAAMQILALPELNQKDAPEKKAESKPEASSGGGGGGGDIAAGKAAFLKYACQTCHNVDANIRLVGPALFDIGSRMSREKVLESIMKPDAVVATGYPPGLMTATLNGQGFYQKATPKEIKAMVDYLMSKKGK